MEERRFLISAGKRGVPKSVKPKYQTTMSDGTVYLVHADGSWRRASSRRFMGRDGMTHAAKRRSRKGKF